MKSKKICIAGLCLMLCLLLPFVTGQIPQIGNALSPMHIPVLICGMVCGGIYGALVGFIAPLLRFFLFGMPVIFPTGIAMSFELAAYGLASGIIYKMLPKKTINIYISLISTMALGRTVWGIVRWIMGLLFGIEFSWQIFISAAFVMAVPGIICHILLIPPVIMAYQRVNSEAKIQTDLQKNIH